MRIIKTVKVDNVTYEKNEIAWLRATRWDESGDFSYLVEINGKQVIIEKKYIEFD